MVLHLGDGRGWDDEAQRWRDGAGKGARRPKPPHSLLDTDCKSGASTGDTVADFVTGTGRIDFASGPAGTGTAITDAVKLAGAGTAGAVTFTDIAHGALA